MRYFFTHLIETERAESHLPKERFNKVFLDSFLLKLRNSYIHKITHKEKKVKFTAPVFRFVWNGFNLLNPISKGEVSLKNIGKGTYISYKLYFWEFFLYSLLFSLIPFLGIFPDNFYRFIVFGIIWMIYAISTIIATNRFENYLKNLIDEINEKVKR